VIELCEDQSPGPGGNDDRELRELMAAFDAPAYVRRARQVEGAYDQLVERCRRKREQWLLMARTRLGQLKALAGDWEELRPYLADADQLYFLHQLHDELKPRIRVAIEPTTSPRALRRALVALCDSLERFNERWRVFLDDLDLGPVNVLREDYNRHYLLEKECALRSPRLAREGFRPLRPLTTEDLADVLPLLSVPLLA
jgi:hypothetical protein